MKNKFIEYPQTLKEHIMNPGISIENNNLIYVIGNCKNVYVSRGVIECFDIRDKKWFVIDELHKILDIENEKRSFQCIMNIV